jgi:CheY-like chemotaxis protein
MILIVDPDTAFTQLVHCHLERLLPGVPVLEASNGLQALAQGHEHCQQLRVVGIEAALPLLDGRILGAALRRLAPRAVMVPFTAHNESLAFFEELGCEAPLLKPTSARRAARRFVYSYERSAPPVPQAAWFTAMCAQADALAACAAPKARPAAARISVAPPDLPIIGADREERLRQAQALLNRYMSRVGPADRGREIAQSLKLIEQCLSA